MTVDRIFLHSLRTRLDMRFGVSIEYIWQHLSPIQAKWTGAPVAGT
jgi:hypothetical protein